MKKVILLFNLSVLMINFGLAQNLFQKNKDFRSIGHAENAGIQAFEAFDVDYKVVQALLQDADMEFSEGNGVTLSLPVLDQGIQDFIFYESPCMMPGISAKYPFIKSFKGQGVQDKSMVCRLDFGVGGMHGAIKTTNGTVYIDPTEGSNLSNYLVYYIKDQHTDANASLPCGHDPNDVDVLAENNNGLELEAGLRSGEQVPLRIYRLAISTTGEFGETLGQTVENTLSLLNTSVNRMNMIFENELAIKMVLVDDNDMLLNFDSDTDPFFDGRNSGARPDNPGPGLLSENPTFINNKIGFGNYDIGHIYTRGCYSVGGVASLGSMCGGAGNRARGVTCFFGGNIANVTVRTVAHEIGHQMSATHSFNHCDMVNESAGTAYEPGSGITIMSYAGGCQSNNLANTNYDVYHVGSLQQIYNFTRLGNGSSCGVEQEFGNHEPDVSLEYEDGFSIPIRTPFELTGIATDEENDTMSFSWEQFNKGPLIDALGSPWGNAPTFRNYYPDVSKTRHFPVLSNTLNNISNVREVLPTYSRDLDFMFVARDNHVNGGTATWQEVEFYASDKAGPFKVLSQNQNDSYEVGERVLVQWDVANTDQDPINTKHVDVYLSTDGGYTMHSMLLENTLNDGEEYVFIPDAVSSECRVKIKAADNIYYDYNDANFNIEAASSPGYYFNLENTAYDVCVPTTFSIPIEGVSYAGYDEQIEFSVIDGLPADVPHSFSNNNIPANASTSLDIDFSNSIYNAYYVVTVQSISTANDTIIRTVELEVTTADHSEIANVYPPEGSSGNAVTPFFKWIGSVNADSYTIELSTNPKFEESNTRTLSNIEADSVAFQEILEKGTVYYWRILGENKCGTADFADIYSFSTLSESCNSYSASDLPKNISQSGTPTVESKTFITAQGTVSDINVSVKGSHTYISQLHAFLVSPSGTEARLFANNCFNLTNFDCTFDDQSSFDISCPLTGGKIFKPQHDLSRFNGENIEGEWTLRIDDTNGGDGGQFQNFDIDICSSVSSEGPYIFNNDTLFLIDNQRRNIGESLLRAKDPNNGAAELIYTIVQTPKIGTILLDGNALSVGDQFTQAAIDATRFDYRHEGENIPDDQFYFTVIDGEGGWIQSTAFNIRVEEFLGTNDPLDVTDVFAVYPNPTTGNIVLKSKTFNGNYSLQVLSTDGKLLYDGERSGASAQLDLSPFRNGMYILKIENPEIRQVVKLVKH